jgi:hypothetical protein
MQSDRFAREIVAIFGAFVCSALAAADAQSVGRHAIMLDASRCLL